MTMKIGEWVAYNEDGLWFGVFGHDAPSYKTKKALIGDISAATLDARSTPKVRRIGKGEYRYTPKSCDTGCFEQEFCIVQLTKENIRKFQDEYNELMNDDD